MAFFKSLYSSMSRPVDESFFQFQEPKLEGVSTGLFQGVKESYGLDVVECVAQIAKQYQEEVIMVANLTMQEARIVLARQRRDYGKDVDLFPPQYPVMEQAENIDDTPVNNIGCERTCGKVDYRLQKLKDLQAVSRSIILQTRPRHSGKTSPQTSEASDRSWKKSRS